MDDLARLKRRRTVWGTLFGICITLLSIVILFLLFKANLDDLLGLVRQISFLPLLVTLPVYILVLYGSSLAWSRIMNDLRVKLPSRQHQLIYVVTNAAKRIPGSLWHVVGRVAWYNQLGISKRLTTLANVLEYVLVLLSGMVLSLFLFPTVTRLQDRGNPAILCRHPGERHPAQPAPPGSSLEAARSRAARRRPAL